MSIQEKNNAWGIAVGFVIAFGLVILSGLTGTLGRGIMLLVAALTGYNSYKVRKNSSLSFGDTVAGGTFIWVVIFLIGLFLYPGQD